MQADTGCLNIGSCLMWTCLYFLSYLSVHTYGSVIKTTEFKEIHIGLNPDGSLIEPKTVPQCRSDQIILVISYAYHQLQCRFNQDCVSTHIEPLRPAEESLLHYLCSMRQECTYLSFPLRSDTQKNTTNSIAIKYECIDRKQQANICEETVRYFSDVVYLTSVDVKDSFAECDCFVNNGRFTVSVTDVRLTKNDETCSPAKLSINTEEFLCDPFSASHGSVFRGGNGKPLKDAYISLVQNSHTDFPDMVLVTLRSESSSKLICNEQTDKKIRKSNSSTTQATTVQTKISSTISEASDNSVTLSGISPGSNCINVQYPVMVLLIIIVGLLIIIPLAPIIILLLLYKKNKRLFLGKRNGTDIKDDTGEAGIQANSIATGELHTGTQAISLATDELHTRTQTNSKATGELHTGTQTNSIATGELHTGTQTNSIATGELHTGDEDSAYTSVNSSIVSVFRQ